MCTQELELVKEKIFHNVQSAFDIVEYEINEGRFIHKYKALHRMESSASTTIERSLKEKLRIHVLTLLTCVAITIKNNPLIKKESKALYKKTKLKKAGIYGCKEFRDVGKFFHQDYIAIICRIKNGKYATARIHTCFDLLLCKHPDMEVFVDIKTNGLELFDYVEEFVDSMNNPANR